MNALTIGSLLGGGFLAYQAVGSYNASRLLSAAPGPGGELKAQAAQAAERNAALYGLGAAALLSYGGYRLVRSR